MTDISLDRTDWNWVILGSGRSKCSSNCRCFQWITGGRAFGCLLASECDPEDLTTRGHTSSMRLEIVCLGKVKTCQLIGGPDQFLLCFCRGQSDAWGFAILIHTSSSNHRPDDVIVPKGICQRLQSDDSSAFTTRVSIGLVIKGLALAVGAEEMQRCHCDLHLRHEEKVSATHQGLHVRSDMARILHLV